MCGIAGEYNLSKKIDEKSLLLMCKKISHRGPDDEGIFINRNKTVGLGSRRLAIINVSSKGHMPMSNEDKTIWLVFNGEIFNFGEYQDQLVKKGHKLVAQNDTEIIIHLYEEKGIDFLQDLRGFFVLALWDEKKDTLILARDRVGKKPLFYAKTTQGIVFGSEIQSLLSHNLVSKEPNLSVISEYLSYQAIPSPQSGFKQISKLPAAHYAIFSKEGLKIKKYWNLNYQPKLDISYEEAKKGIKEKLYESTKLRMISDVPLGAFLSGGIDSSAIVAMMSKISNKPIKTFSIGFKEQKFNELDYAQEIATKYGCDHHEFQVEPKALDVLPTLIKHFGEPYADPAALPTYYLSELTKKFVTVALNGDGGDENFAGYERYRMIQFINMLDKKLLRTPSQLTLKLLSRYFLKNNSKQNYINSVFNVSEEKRYSSMFELFDHQLRDRLFDGDFRKKHCNNYDDKLSDIYKNCNSADKLDKMMYTDFMFYIPEILMPKVDIVSMAVSLEARSPFLDHKFIEFTASLPSGWKLKNNKMKSILKDVLSDELPDNILNRPKHGFSLPLNKWFREELNDTVKSTLLSKQALDRKIFNKKELELFLEDHSSGKKNYGDQIWALLCLETWFQQLVD